MSSPDTILLAHGEGARLTRRLIHEVLLPPLSNPYLEPLADAALLPAMREQPVLTTDGFVVDPLFFPGGDIGSLAVYGTVNDLASAGAAPLYLTLGFIIEEGLPVTTLKRVIASVQTAASRSGVMVVAGDTKVVPRGKADKLFLHAAGLGRRLPGLNLGAGRVCPGDSVFVSGTLGDHGMAVLAAREEMGEAGQIESDSAPLHELAWSLVAIGDRLRFLRDATRGGVAAVLHELADDRGLPIIIDEACLPIAEPVRGLCELLGIDPLHVANEGKLVVVAAKDATADVEALLRGHPLGRRATRIGEVGESAGAPADVLVRNLLGNLRVLDEPLGAPLPRIC